MKPTLKVWFFKAGTIPAQTGKLELNLNMQGHGAETSSDGCSKECSRPLAFCITLFFLGAFSSSTYGKKNINY